MVIWLEVGEILVLTKKDVESVLTPKRVLKVCDEVFKLIGNGEVIQGSPYGFSTGKLVKDPKKICHFSGRSGYIKPWSVAGEKWGGSTWKTGVPKKGLPSIFF